MVMSIVGIVDLVQVDFRFAGAQQADIEFFEVFFEICTAHVIVLSVGSCIFFGRERIRVEVTSMNLKSPLNGFLLCAAFLAGTQIVLPTYSTESFCSSYSTYTLWGPVSRLATCVVAMAPEILTIPGNISFAATTTALTPTNNPGDETDVLPYPAEPQPWQSLITLDVGKSA